MFRTLTGQLDAMVTRSQSVDDSEEWEQEESGTFSDSDAAPAVATKTSGAPVATLIQPRQPVPVQYSNTPEDKSPNTSGQASGLRTARTPADEDESEYEYEDEDEDEDE
jgi:hypothetical protein